MTAECYCEKGEYRQMWDELKSKPAFQILEEMKRTGIVYDMQGNPCPFEDHESYLALYQIMRSLKPDMSLELGFYGF